jgi:hypothetical protein
VCRAIGQTTLPAATVENGPASVPVASARSRRSRRIARQGGRPVCQAVALLVVFRPDDDLASGGRQLARPGADRQDSAGRRGGGIGQGIVGVSDKTEVVDEGPVAMPPTVARSRTATRSPVA